MRVAVEPAGKGEGVCAATNCRVPPDEDATEYVTKVADALADRLTMQLRAAPQRGAVGRRHGQQGGGVAMTLHDIVACAAWGFGGGIGFGVGLFVCVAVLRATAC